MPNSIPEKPWTHISADFIMKLPLAQGYDSILVVVNRLTKMVHFIPTMKKTSVKGLAWLFRDNMWKLYGLSESIILDRGPQFVAGLIQEEMKKYADKKRAEVDNYKVEDLVMLSTKDLKYQMVSRKTEKLTERFVNPYKIKKIISSNAMELELPSIVKVHLVVNVSRIC